MYLPRVMNESFSGDLLDPGSLFKKKSTQPKSNFETTTNPRAHQLNPEINQKDPTEGRLTKYVEPTH
jgi:hypothetical protein